MNDRHRELESMRQYFITHVAEPNLDAEKVCYDELQVALLRMTEKKLIADEKCKAYELELQAKDARIAELLEIVTKKKGGNHFV
jgi:hypothetical protein